MDCSTRRVSFEPRMRDWIDWGVRRGMSLGSMRLLSRWATIFITETRTV